MPEKCVVIFVFDGFADWEAAYALAELRRSGKHTVVAAGVTASPVVSMGGLRVLPDCVLGEVRPEDVALFILPGGDAWESDSLTSLVAPLLRELAARQIPIAAICGATLAVARAGLLRGRHHTSTERAYLEKMVPAYAEAEHYVESLAVNDAGLITASGLGAVEFAREIFAELKTFSASDLNLWFDLFKYGETSRLHLPEDRQ